MEYMKRTSSWSYRFDNSMYVAYHEQVYKKIDTIVEDQLPTYGLTKARRDQWKAYVEQLSDLNRESRAPRTTEETWECNTERRRIFRLMIQIITSEKTSTESEYRKAAVDVARVWSNHIRDVNTTDDKFTSLVKALLKDNEKDGMEENLQKINMDKYLPRLEAANDEYELMKSIRVNETQQILNKRKDFAALREVFEEFYTTQTERIHSADVLCEDPEDKAAIQSLLDEINAINASFKTSYKISMARSGKKVEEPSEDEDPDDPDTPPTPDEPKDPETPENPDEETGGNTENPDEEGGTHFEPVE